MDENTQRNVEHELTRLDDDLTRVANETADLPILRQNIKDLACALEILISSRPLDAGSSGLPFEARQQIQAIVARLTR